MSKKIETNQKHMNQDNRVVIEKRLDASVSFRAIDIELGKDPTTIAKEVKKHRVFQGHNKFNEKPYRCANARDCHRKNVCSTVLFCRRECRNCNKCHIYCLDYKPFDYHCPLTDKAPFVCNGCPKKNPCRLDKYYYRAVRAQNEYKTILMESRRGINLTEEELAALDATVSPLILNGQSPYMILQNHPEITQCEKTIYNYIDQGTLSVCSLDLPKRVTYKPRQAHAFDRLTQEDVNLMMSHINSANRESLEGLTPFKLAKLMLPKKLLKHFGLKEVPGDEVILTPALLKGKMEL